MTARAERCHCGHDLASHYRDPSTGKRHACGCMGCDCGSYVHEDNAATPRTRQPRVPRDKPQVTYEWSYSRGRREVTTA